METSILCSPRFGLFICSVVSCRLVKQQVLSQNLCHSVNLWHHRIIRELVFTGVWAFCEKSPKFLAGYEVDVWDRALDERAFVWNGALCTSHICFTPLSWKWDCLLISPLNAGFTLHYSMLLSPLQQYLFLSACGFLLSWCDDRFFGNWELWLIHGVMGCKQGRLKEYFTQSQNSVIIYLPFIPFKTHMLFCFFVCCGTWQNLMKLFLQWQFIMIFPWVIHMDYFLCHFW